MKEEIRIAVQGLSDIRQRGKIRALRPGTMGDHEQGWSGAAVCRVEVAYEDGTQESVMLKEADLKERAAMKTLTDQGHRNTPTAFSEDVCTHAPKWIAMEDVGDVTCPPLGTNWTPLIADALAQIHVDNLGMGAQMPWLPHADRHYWTDYLLTKISVDHFEAMMEQNAAFAREFGHYLPRLRTKAASFANDMVMLYDEGDCLTLTHGDLQTVDGDHIHYRDGKPYILDFGWCHYAPFYIDLVSYFTFEQSKVYFHCMQEKGVSIQYADFEERLRAACPYSGFIYLCPSIRQWAAGPTEVTGKRLLQMLRTILADGFPDDRRELL